MSYGSTPGGAQAQGGKIGGLRNQVDEVKGLLTERDLSNSFKKLNSKAGDLANQPTFHRQNNKLPWWKNTKLWIIVIIIIIIITLLIIGASIAIPLGLKKGKK